MQYYKYKIYGKTIDPANIHMSVSNNVWVTYANRNKNLCLVYKSRKLCFFKVFYITIIPHTNDDSIIFIRDLRNIKNILFNIYRGWRFNYITSVVAILLYRFTPSIRIRFGENYYGYSLNVNRRISLTTEGSN